MNIRGIVPVGRTAMFLTVAVMCPFLILFFTGFIHTDFAAVHHHAGMSSLGMAIFTIMWNFIGWDNATTYAGEVDKPIRSYLKAIFLAFSSIYIIYIAITWLALHSGIPGTVFAEKGIPYLGELIGGKSLGTILSIGGMASMMGIFCAVLLSVSRVPAVMGKDNLLPKIFTRLHPKYQTPYVSIIACACIVSLLILLPLADLIVMDICLYTGGVSLGFAALISLRKKAAGDQRPFRIPLEKKGLLLLFLAPTLIFVLALIGSIIGSGENKPAVVYAILALLSAPVVWIIVKPKV
ncbi:MAG: APC family permease [Puia sp.]